MGLDRRGVCLVIAAPSGAGKSSIAQGVLAQEIEAVASVSVTTRGPRPGEVEGRDYFFRSIERFEAMAAAGELLEHAVVFGRGYGTPRAPVETALSGGRDVILDIDWQGWRQVKAALPADVVGVFVLPPSLEKLEARLVGRRTDDPMEVARRMAAARAEISHWDEFDHVLVNEDLSASIDVVLTVLRAARCATRRSVGVARLARQMVGGPAA